MRRLGKGVSAVLLGCALGVAVATVGMGDFLALPTIGGEVGVESADGDGRAVLEKEPQSLAPMRASSGGALPAAVCGVSASVQVCDPDGQPVVAAEVFLARAAVLGHSPATTLPCDPFAFDVANPLRAVSSSVHTDERGRCQLPLTGGHWLVARTGRLYAARQLPHATERIPSDLLLIVYEDHTVEVRTVDSERRPMGGVPVGIETTALDDGVASFPRRTTWLATTDANGRLVLPHAQRWSSGAPDRPLRLRALVPGADAALVEFDPAGPVLGPYELVVPATGRLVVEVVGPDRRPLGGAEVTLQGLVRARTDADGRCVFAQVAANAPIEVRATTAGREAVLSCRGPSAGGQVTVPIVLDGPVVRFDGRLIARDGAPRRGRHVRLVGLPAGVDCEPVRTGDDGAFCFELPVRLAGRLLARAHIELLSANGHLLGERAPLPALVPQIGDNRLGSLVLGLPVALLQGSIAGQTDLASCTFRLEAQGADGWSAVDDFDVLPGQPGEFELRGSDPGRPLRWSVHARGFAPAGPFPLVPGQRGVVVTPALGSPLHVKQLWATSRSLRLVRMGGGEGEATWEPTTRRDGDYERADWVDLPQGQYRLEAASLTGAGFEPVLALDAFAGCEVEDLRLVPYLQLPQ